MKRVLISLPLAISLLLAGVVFAQDAAEPERESGADKPTVEQEALVLEAELVRMIENMLAKGGTVHDAERPKKQEKAPAAEVPEPEKPSMQRLKAEIAEWKSNSLVMVDVTTNQKLEELEKKRRQQIKRLEEKLKKPERIVIDPKRPAPAAGSNEELKRNLLKEIDRQIETERQEIQKEAKHEKQYIEALAKEMEKSLQKNYSEESHRESGQKPRKTEK